MSRLLLAAALLAAVPENVAAQTSEAARVRASFLEMIGRPRVPLAPETQPRIDAGAYRSEHFTFSSEAGERVPGVFFKTASASTRRPVVIFLHGTGSRKEEFLALMRSFADRGLAAAAIDARHHGSRITSKQGGNAQYFAAMLETYRTGKGRPYLYDTVWDVMRLVDYLETRADVDPKRIGLMGISKGGTEAYLAAAVDPRIAVTVPIIGVQGFRWALEHDQWQARVSTFGSAVETAARDARVPTIDAAFVRRFYDRVAPGIYSDYDAGPMLALIAPRPVLVINGDSDPRTPLAGVQEAVATARATYEKLSAAEKLGVYLQPDAGHVVTPVAELVMADWFVRWLLP